MLGGTISKYQFSSFILDTARCELTQSGAKVELEPQVYCMLELLVSKHLEIISRDDFINSVWDGRQVSNNTIDNRMKTVRAVIGDDGRRQKFIKTYPNRGYKFIGRVQVLKETDHPSHSSNTNSASPDISDQIASPEDDNATGIIKTFIRSPKAIVASIPALAAIFISAATLIDRNTQNAQEPSRLEASAISPRPHNADHMPQPGKASKIAVMPIEVIGEDRERPYLAKIIESELRQAIMAIQGLTVVSITADNPASLDNENIKDVTKLLGLDYVVRVEKIYLGRETQLSVQLVCNIDNVVLWTKKYQLEESSDQALSEWPAASAINATIEIANTLEVSINQQANYLVPYAFQEKLVRAKSLIKSDRLAAINEAIIILEEVIKEEDNYLPAYAELFRAHGARFNYLPDGSLGDVGRMKDISEKMKQISPNAPETLLSMAVMSARTSDGTEFSANGENNKVWEGLLDAALERNPNYGEAYGTKAYFMTYSGQYSPEDIDEAYENALKFNPTDPVTLYDYVIHKKCDGDIEAAWAAARNNIVWNPQSGQAHATLFDVAMATGRYEVALQSINKIQEKEHLRYEETVAIRDWFINLGAPIKAIPYVTFQPTKGLLYAMAGETEKAVKAVEDYENFYISQTAMLIVSPEEIPKDYNPNPYYLDITETIDGYSAKTCALSSLVTDIYALSFSDKRRSDLFKDLLVQYFDENPLESFQTRVQYTTLMSLYILEEDYDKAIEIMDIAMDKGFIFINSFKMPLLRRLTTHPEFPERLKIMQERADALLLQTLND